MKEFQELEEEKQVHIDGITWNSKKSEIQNAIECLKCPDELLEKYLIVLSLKYEKIGRLIAGNGDFKHHSHNRLYVFNTARQILADQPKRSALERQPRDDLPALMMADQKEWRQEDVERINTCRI